MIRKLTLFLLLFSTIMLATIVYEVPSSTAVLQWGTTYTINVHTDGSAHWTYERKTLINNETDMLEWWNEISEEKRLAFENKMISIVNQTQQITNRNMSITPVTLDYNLTGNEGIITYLFDWNGFAKIGDKTIEIGDAFSKQFIDLNQDTLLIIQYPEGYTSSETSPAPTGIYPDDRAISWQGPMTFGENEPRVILVQGLAQGLNPWQTYTPIAVGASAITFLSVGLWFFFYRKRAKVGNTTPIPPLCYEDDEQRITALLQRAGGSVLQSSITREFRFSKAKTSQLLNDMEKKGKVTRQKKGREKIVTLKQQNQNPQKN